LKPHCVLDRAYNARMPNQRRTDSGEAPYMEHIEFFNHATMPTDFTYSCKGIARNDSF
jgi:hypothetical protein